MVVFASGAARAAARAAAGAASRCGRDSGAGSGCSAPLLWVLLPTLVVFDVLLRTLLSENGNAAKKAMAFGPDEVRACMSIVQVDTGEEEPAASEVGLNPTEYAIQIWNSSKGDVQLSHGHDADWVGELHEKVCHAETGTAVVVTSSKSAVCWLVTQICCCCCVGGCESSKGSRSLRMTMFAPAAEQTVRTRVAGTGATKSRKNENHLQSGAHAEDAVFSQTGDNGCDIQPFEHKLRQTNKNTQTHITN